MTFYRRIPVALALCGATACSGAPTPKPGGAPPAPTQQIAGDGGDGTGTGVDLGTFDVKPVKAPGEVVLHLRWANPGATAATLAGYANLPGGRINAMLSQAVKELVRDGLSGKVDVSAFSNLVRTDAPVDFVVVADVDAGGQVPDPMVAVSIGLSSVQAALNASKGKPRKIADGVWEIGTQDKWGDPCAVSAAAGKAPARLVCGDRKKHVEKVAAFVSRNVAMKADPPHDIRVEVGLRGLLDRYGRQWANQAKGLPVLMEEAKIGNLKFDQALMDTADALAAEAGALIHDGDSMVIDLGLDATKGAHIGMELKFAGQQSWFVQTMVDGAQNAGPAPDIAWHAPKSSDYVAWGRTGDPKRFDKMFAAVRAMLEGYLEAEKIGSAADRKAMANLIRLVSRSKHVPSVLAWGHFQNSNTKPTSITHVIDDVVGWYLLGYEEKPNEVIKWLREAVKVYNRRTLQKLMKDELGPSDAKHLPKVRAIGPPPGLGGRGLAIEVVVPDLEDPLDSAAGPPAGNAKPKTVDVKMYMLVMGAGSRTWIGVAGDKLELAKLMAGVRAKGPSSLSSRSDLAQLKSESHNSGAFTSLTGVVGMVKPVVYALMSSPGAGSAGFGQEILKVIEQMPNKGTTPIFMFADVTPSAQPTISWSVDVPQGTLEDLGFVLQKGLQMVGP
jgi:hypothetical protein